MIGIIQIKRMIQLIIIVLCTLFLFYGRAFAHKFSQVPADSFKIPASLQAYRG